MVELRNIEQPNHHTTIPAGKVVSWGKRYRGRQRWEQGALMYAVQATRRSETKKSNRQEIYHIPVV